MCESYDRKCQTSAASGNTSCSTLQQCDHIHDSSPACYALFGQNKDGGLNIIMKGCIAQSAPECAASTVCNGQRKSVHNSQALYHCCCTEDKCNRDVIIFVSEETEKNCAMKGKNLFIAEPTNTGFQFILISHKNLSTSWACFTGPVSL